MNEENRFKLLIFLSIFVSITGLYFAYFKDLRLIFHDLTADYTAELTIDEQLYLKERYIYRVKKSDKYRMLFRYWKAPLTYKEDLNQPYIKVVSVKSEYPWYIKDYKGHIYSSIEDSASKSLVLSKAYQNEIGLVNPDYFTLGFYDLNIEYLIFPPVEADQNFIHLNLKLAEKHIPYTNIKILINDPFKRILEIFPHIPDYTIQKTENRWIIEGKAKENGLVEIEILVRKFDLSGFYRNYPDVYKLTIQANKNPLKTFFEIVKIFFSFLTVTFPVFLFVFYHKFGKEKKFTVPKFLSFIPDEKKKPYIVNMIFQGDSAEGDENAFYSTLLDLHLKGKIQIKPYNTDIQIDILDPYVEDSYEKLVIHFLKQFTIDPENKIFSSAALENKVKSLYAERNKTSLAMLKTLMDRLFKYKNYRVINRYLDYRGKVLFRSIAFFLIGISGVFSVFYLISELNNMFQDIDLYPSFILSLALLIQTAAVLLTPTQFLGRWKGEKYLEKLQWDAFRNFLSDLAMIERYSPEDIVIWKKWLIYATALGVAKKVEKAMKELTINIPELEINRRTRINFHRIYRTTSLSLSKLQSSSSSTGGGGFGSGGGFGGGGAGGR